MLYPEQMSHRYWNQRSYRLASLIEQALALMVWKVHCLAIFRRSGDFC